MKRLLELCLVLLAFSALALSGCGKDLDAQASGPATPNVSNVSISNDVFTPNAVTIAVGGTVVWKNADAIKYSVTVDGLFDHILDPGTSFQFTFNSPGTFIVRDRMQATAPSMTVMVK
ncbi:MAG: hypothetical protein RBU37_24470 [Myxococcota bacterium]|jgi:plastocyanin|nr:hypothetical protein [Myxococcota bacterium]